MTYAPNQEKDGVLGCGCIESWAFAIRVLGSGEGKWWQYCPRHPNGPGKWGLQPIKRDATVYERYGWYEFGIPATKRRSTGTPKWVLEMSERSKQEAHGNGWEAKPLF